MGEFHKHASPDDEILICAAVLDDMVVLQFDLRRRLSDYMQIQVILMEFMSLHHKWQMRKETCVIGIIEPGLNVYTSIVTIGSAETMP